MDRDIKLSNVMNLGPIWLPRAHSVAMHSSYISAWTGTLPVHCIELVNIEGMRWYGGIKKGEREER